MTTSAIWRPSAARVAATGLDRFRRHVEAAADVRLVDSRALHGWTVEDPGAFWSTLWSFLGLPGSPGPVLTDRGDRFEDAVFFPHGRIDVAAALLGEPSDDLAIIEAGESGEWRELSRRELHRQVGVVARELRSLGVGAGDVVGAWTPNVSATVVTMIASLAVGATFTSASSDFGAPAVLDRFHDVRPRALLVAQDYRYGGRRFDRRAHLADIVSGLPSLERIIVLGSDVPSFGGRAVSYDALVAGHRDDELDTSMRPFNDPGWILYSSGTTGKPKAIVHRVGGVLLKHLSELRLHCDVRDGDVVFYFTTTGWMMWNWLTSALAARSTIVLYDGSPTHPHDEVLFDVAARAGTTYFGASARYYDSLRRAGRSPRRVYDLHRVRSVASTGSPLAPDTYRWIYDAIGDDVHLISKSGGTDLCGGLVSGDPTAPVFAGELQMPALGLAIDVLDDEGSSCPPGVVGELVCATPFPSMPLRFVGDRDGHRLHDAYYRRFPGHWHQSDFASWTTQGGMVIHGRSDATLNASGVRIGTAEIYAVLAEIAEVTGAVAVGQRVDADTRVVLLVTLADGAVLDDDLVGRIRTALRDRCSPRHVPAVVRAVGDLPRTSNGKLMELLVADLINGDDARGLESVANPESVAMVRAVSTR